MNIHEIKFNKTTMKRYNKLILVLVIFGMMIMISCEKFLEPLPEKRFSEEDLTTNPAYAEGVLLRAYTLLPSSYNFTTDMASDNAVSNSPSDAVNQIVLGGWTSNSGTISQWGKAYEAFLYINKFLKIAPNVVWDYKSPQKSASFYKRLVGEAYALRGIWGFYLLQNHGGYAGEQLLGYPILTRELIPKDDYKLPRNTYAECVAQILADLDSAIAKLPLKWADIAGNDIYNATMGARFWNRVNGLTAKFFKARVLLYAASPAFSASGYTWQQAAESAADIMIENNGITGLSSADVEFYKTAPTNTSREVIWSSSRVQSKYDLEANSFPPSLFGKGNVNPTQDFVNAFPNKDGTPFTGPANSLSQFNNRDPRLAKYVVYNGSTFKSKVMDFSDKETSIDAPGRNVNATLSGYYLKKFLSESVSIDPSKPFVGKDVYYAYARYTEALLNFAEAANESVGPDVPIKGFTARSVINAIRTRAGITSTAYINGLDQAGLRQAIRNERRIELCFEGHRFWDIRRWNDIDAMKRSVNGIKFSSDNLSATVSEIQKREYKDYQIYGPIPYSETHTYDIKQNDGWQ